MAIVGLPLLTVASIIAYLRSKKPLSKIVVWLFYLITVAYLVVLNIGIS